MNIIALIPARLDSTRFNRKLMMDLCGKPVITRTYNAVVSTNLFTSTIVVTQDKEVYQEIRLNNGNSILIDKEYNSGTDRIADACIDIEADVIINIQGDEPLLNTDHLEQLIDCFDDPSTSISTLALKIKAGVKLEEGKVFLTKDKHNFALYFSRYPIPYNRDLPKEEWSNNHQYYQHIGIYGFRKDALERFANMNESPLEKSEKLEQLRWLEAGEKIKVTVTDKYSQPVDTKEDLEKVRTIFQSKGE